MPVTMAAFTIGALGMIGVPPVAGFISKWYLGIGGLQSGAPWVVAVLAGSSLLNAAYFLPMLYRAWLLPAPQQAGFRELGTIRDGMLILPAVVTATAALGAGVLASSVFSPLGWAKLIAEMGYLE